MEEKKEEAKMPDSIGKKSSSANNDKLLAAASAIPIIGLIMYFAMDDASDFVRHYSRQGATLIIVNIFALIPLLNCIAIPILFISIVVLIIKALQEDKTYRLPIIADLGESIFK